MAKDLSLLLILVFFACFVSVESKARYQGLHPWEMVPDNMQFHKFRWRWGERLAWDDYFEVKPKYPETNVTKTIWEVENHHQCRIFNTTEYIEILDLFVDARMYDIPNNNEEKTKKINAVIQKRMRDIIDLRMPKEWTVTNFVDDVLLGGITMEVLKPEEVDTILNS